MSNVVGSSQGNFTENIIHFQVEWVDDFSYILKNKKRVKSDIMDTILEVVEDKKQAKFLARVIYRIYLYMSKKGKEGISVYLKDNVFVCKVDIFKKNLICVIVPDSYMEEYLEEIIDYIGTKLPDLIDYSEVYKAVWWDEIRDVVKATAFLVLVLGVMIGGLRFVVWPIFFSKKKNKTVSSQKVQEVFVGDEQQEAFSYILLNCIDMLKKEMYDLSKVNHVRIKEIRMRSHKSLRSVGCDISLIEQYDYPAPDTVKSGEYYEREKVINKSLDREQFLHIRDKFKVSKVGNRKECLKVIARLGGEVQYRKGGISDIEVRAELTPYQAFFLPDLLKELVKVCGWDVLEVKSFDLNVLHNDEGKGKIEFLSEMQFRE